MVKGTISILGIYMRVASIESMNQLTKGYNIVNKHHYGQRYRICGIIVVRNYDNTINLVYRVQRDNARTERFISYDEVKTDYWQIY